MNIQQNELFKSGMKNLSAAMDKIKFNGSLNGDECNTIRGLISEARASYSHLYETYGNNKQLELLNNLADTLEKAVNAVDDSKTYL